jgi:hypothetical protein
MAVGEEVVEREVRVLAEFPRGDGPETAETAGSPPPVRLSTFTKALGRFLESNRR